MLAHHHNREDIGLALAKEKEETKVVDHEAHPTHVHVVVRDPGHDLAVIHVHVQDHIQDRDLIQDLHHRLITEY